MRRRFLCILLACLLLLPATPARAEESLPNNVSEPDSFDEANGSLAVPSAATSQKSFLMGDKPSFRITLDSDTNYSATSVFAYIENTGSKPVKIYSSGAEMRDKTASSFNRKLKMIDTDALKNGDGIVYIDSVTLQPGEEKTIGFVVDGSSTWYDKDTRLCFIFVYDGADYTFMGAANTVKLYEALNDVTGVQLNKTSASIKKGKTLQLSAKTLPRYQDEDEVAPWRLEYTWKSSNPKVAKVSSTGKVTAVSKGTATITCTTVVGQKKATCKVTVTESTAVNSVKLNKTSASITRSYKTLKLSATISPSNATNKKITWSSSNSFIAKVNSNGVVSVVSPKVGGTVTITATSANGKKATCKVTVKLDPVTEFVTRLYQVCLDRNPEDGGLTWWVQRLKKKQDTGGSCAWGFFDSTEFKNHRYNNSAFLDHAYKAFFDRKADAAGKNYWLGEMRKGMTRKQVVAGFAASNEFKALCRSFNIRP